jgi:hypothetical protein
MAIDTDTNKAVAPRLVQDVFNNGNMQAFDSQSAGPECPGDESRLPPGRPGDEASFSRCQSATDRSPNTGTTLTSSASSANSEPFPPEAFEE